MKDKINPNLRKLAELTYNPSLEVPDLEKITEETQPQINKLEKDAQGRPIIKLTPLEKTAINTKTQQEHNTLMQVYECGGWRWSGGELPTYSKDRGDEEEISVTGGYVFYTNAINRFSWGFQRFYLDNGWKVIPTKEFYNKQNITDDMIKEINEYFESKK